MDEKIIEMSLKTENQDLIYKKARERAENLVEFYKHLLIYVMVCSVLVIINLISNRGYFWAIWPIIGWGIGIGSHAFCTFIIRKSY